MYRPLLLVASAIALSVLTTAFCRSEEEPGNVGPRINRRHETLKSDAPLPIYDANPQHLWNRLFSLLYVRPRFVPPKDGKPAVVRYEGGDVIEFLAWGKTKYWSSREVFEKLNPLLDEFLKQRGAAMIADPMKRAVFQHDLWAAYDHLIHQNIERTGDLATRQRRDVLCGKLARCLRQLALPTDTLRKLPDTYALAVKSGAFVPRHDFDASRNYLPHGLLTNPEEWVEIDFHQPRVSHDISERFVTLHTRSLLGRSYYRIYYRFPKGRKQTLAYLKALDAKGIDWKKAAHLGNVLPEKDAPPIPIGTEVVLLQLMMSLDDKLRPVPTNVVESFQFRVYRNINGSVEPETKTGVGINVLDYRLRRRLLFDGQTAGGLAREPEEEPQFRVAIDGLRAPDWGFPGKKVLFQQCADCHMGRKLSRLGVRSIPSIVHSGGFDAGAQMGVVHPLDPRRKHLPATRVVKWKTRHESYRRLLEHLGL